MYNFLLICALLTISKYDIVTGLSRSYSAGGVWSNINSNGFQIRQEPNQLFCGSLVCVGAVNCEILKHGSSITEKCTDSSQRTVDQKSYSGSSFGDDVELYFGPAYARQAEEQSRIINDQVNDQINHAFNNAFNNLPPEFHPNVHRSSAVINGKITSYFSLFIASLLCFLACY